MRFTVACETVSVCEVETFSETGMSMRAARRARGGDGHLAGVVAGRQRSAVDRHLDDPAGVLPLVGRRR